MRIRSTHCRHTCWRQTPVELRAAPDEPGPRRDAVGHQRREHHRRNGAGGKAERQHGNKGAAGAALFADSGPATPSTAPFPNSLRVVGQPALHGIGDERGDDVGGSGNQADHEADNGSAQTRPDGPPHLAAVRQQILQARRFYRAGLFAPADRRISEIPNMPTASGTMPKPSARSGISKVKRA